MHRRTGLRGACLAIVVAAVGGCTGTPTPRLAGEGPITFKAAEAAYIHKAGETRITGEAFFVDRQGKVHRAAGETVRLVPATRYARERFVRLYGGRKFIQANAIPRIAPQPEYVRFTRTAVADGRGRFVFDNVGPGAYYVTAQKIYQRRGSFVREGGAMYQEVRVPRGHRGPLKVVVAGK